VCGEKHNITTPFPWEGQVVLEKDITDSPAEVIEDYVSFMYKKIKLSL
jgi:hypothetical protein